MAVSGERFLVLTPAWGHPKQIEGLQMRLQLGFRHVKRSGDCPTKSIRVRALCVKTPTRKGMAWGMTIGRRWTIVGPKLTIVGVWPPYHEVSMGWTFNIC